MDPLFAILKRRMHVGLHTVEFEEPDLIRVVLHATLGPGESQRIADSILKFVSSSYVLGLIDLTELKVIPTGERKTTAERGKHIPFRGIALYGASFRVRTLAMLLMTVMNAFSKRDNPLRFFDNEAEARVWLAFRREQLKAEQR
jgi:hypothetical protein